MKLVLVGAGGVGKSSISSRIITGDFIDHTMTIGMNVDTWTIVEDDDDAIIKASVFDMGGQEQFRSFQEGLVTGADALLIVCDLTSFNTFLKIDEWLPLIDSIPRERWIMVANKSDVNGSIEDLELDKKARELGIPVIKVSAKTGENFLQLEEMIEKILKVTLDGGGQART